MLVVVSSLVHFFFLHCSFAVSWLFYFYFRLFSIMCLCLVAIHIIHSTVYNLDRCVCECVCVCVSVCVSACVSECVRVCVSVCAGGSECVCAGVSK